MVSLLSPCIYCVFHWEAEEQSCLMLFIKHYPRSNVALTKAEKVQLEKSWQFF